MHGKVIRVRDDGTLAVLSPRRAIEIETAHPDALSTQDNASILFIKGLSCGWTVQVDVLCDPELKSRNRDIKREISHIPDGNAKINPAPFFVPSLGWNWIQLHEKICCGHLFIFSPGYERSASGELAILHQLLVEVWSRLVESRSDTAHFGLH
jgi:hypothetical protein